MDIYELSQYNENDHELVKSVQNMADDELMLINLTDMDEQPLLEKDGSPVEVSFPKEDMIGFLELMRSNNETFEEMFVGALNAAIAFEELDNKDN